MTKQTADPWVDADTHLDTTVRAEDKELEALAAGPGPADAPTYNPEDFEVEGKDGESLLDYLQRAIPEAEVSVPDKLKEPKVPDVVAAEENPPEPPAVPNAGNVTEHHYSDGSSMTVEKTSKGWKAVLSAGDPAIKDEVFFGATKDEMWQNVAAGKINATKKIREQNRQIKLVAAAEPEPVATPAAPAAPAVRDLTADEVFEIRTALESNPDLAMSTWFQKKTGMSLEALLAELAAVKKDANKGAGAADELTAESVARGFLAERPDYYNLDSNRDTITGWLTKKFLKQTLTAENAETLFDRLVAGGYWTVQNLCEAYDELSESGLLELKPVVAQPEPAPEPVPEPTPRAAASAAEPTAATGNTSQNDERIVRTVRRPRAGLGLSSRETTTVAATKEDPQSPSADDLDNLSDAQLAELWNGVRRTRLTSRR